MSFHFPNSVGPVNHGPHLCPDLVFPTPNFGTLPAGVMAPSFHMPPVQLAPTPVFNLLLPTPALSVPQVSVGTIRPPREEYHPSGIGIVAGTAKVFLKDELPPATKMVGVVASAAIAGYKLHEGIEKAVDAGQPTSEAVVCQTVKVLSEEVTGKALKGAVVGGLPAYFAAAITNPPLAMTVPFVLPLIPDAYKGAQITAHAVGTMAESGCHNAFEMARNIAQKE